MKTKSQTDMEREILGMRYSLKALEDKPEEHEKVKTRLRNLEKLFAVMFGNVTVEQEHRPHRRYRAIRLGPTPTE